MFLRTLTLLCLLSLWSQAQTNLQQYFDGQDTNAQYALIFELDSNSIWQIGPPQKAYLSSAATQPNALITDTLNPYPILDSSVSSTEAKIKLLWPYGILAIQWMQQIDFEYEKDGGIVEFRTSDTSQWQSIFNNPYVYNVFGFDTSHVRQLPNGEMAFTGRSPLENVWLCLDLSWLNQLSGDSTLALRFRVYSDSVDTQQDGWMIDNIWVALTGFHTINEINPEQYMSVGPNPTKGHLQIETKKLGQVQYIKKIELYELSGKMVQEWGLAPVKFSIDIGHHKQGIYLLKVHTNVGTEEFRIQLKP